MLDTVLQIGKALRESPDGLRYFQYVRPCPEDNEKETVFRIAIPVRDDFSFDWDNVYEIVNEYEQKKLYYLTFKTSDSDGLVKYMLGDIFYSRRAKIKLKEIVFGEAGFFRLDKPNAKGVYKFNSFKRAEIDFQEIKAKSNDLVSFRSSFKDNYKYTEKILKYFPGIKIFLEEKATGTNPDSFEKFINDEDKILEYTGRASFVQIKSTKNNKKIFAVLLGDEEPEWDIIKNSEEKVKLLTNFVNGNIFIHFRFKKNNAYKNWYELEDIFTVLKSKIFDNFVEEIVQLKDSFALKKTLFKTLCSGDKKNDIQFPGFNATYKYKSRSFTREELEDLFYAIEFSNSGMLNFSGTDLKLIVLPKGNNLEAKDYEDFRNTGKEIVLRRRNENKYNDNFFLFVDASKTNNNITSFDMIFCRRGGLSSPDVDMVELRGIRKSSLKKIKERISKIKEEVYEKRKKELFTEKKLSYFSLFLSLQNLLGSPQTDYQSKTKFKANPKYQSHLLKIIPKIYTGNYFIDPVLLPAFIENVEYSIRAGDQKFIWLKYDLELIIMLQNTKIEGENFMELINSTSYKAGLLLGKMARNFSGENSPIKSFEKNYVGNLTRRISNLKDLIDFKNELEQKLIMHEKMKFVRNESSELAEFIKQQTESDYDKNKCAFGFFEKYFAPIKKSSFLEKIEKQVEDYKNEENYDDSLVTEIENLISKYKKED